MNWLSHTDNFIWKFGAKLAARSETEFRKLNPELKITDVAVNLAPSDDGTAVKRCITAVCDGIPVYGSGRGVDRTATFCAGGVAYTFPGDIRVPTDEGEWRTTAESLGS